MTRKKIIVSSLFLFCFLVLLNSCISKKREPQKREFPTDISLEVSSTLKSKIDFKNFETSINDQPTKLYVLKNKNGLEATFTSYGQRLVSLMVPDKKGNFDDIVLGFSNIKDYQTKRGTYIGCTLGRYANRIANGIFKLDNVTYKLITNNGPNHSHGGQIGFNNVVWNAEHIKPNEITFSRTSPHMEEGYPGNLKVRVRYVLTDSDELQIYYTATTDKPTVINLSNHSFFNLAGEGNGTVNNHLLMINADYYTPVNKNMIPTGTFENVTGTPFDFRKLKPIIQNLNDPNEQLNNAHGYDHNFVLNTSPTNAKGLVLAAKVLEPISGRRMDVYTSEPGIQFYEGNFLDGGAIGKSNKAYIRRGGFCLETQHFPDSPNQPAFPSTKLMPNATYSSTSVYKFYH